MDPDSGSQTEAALGSPRTDGPPAPGGLGWAWALLLWLPVREPHFENLCISLGPSVHRGLMSQPPGVFPSVQGPPHPPGTTSGQAALQLGWLELVKPAAGWGG